MEAAVPETYGLDELRFYVVELELHSITWFSSLTQPHLEGSVQVMLPVIHNYPLTLALLGEIVEESYLSKYNEVKDARSPAERFGETGVYAYPLLLERIYYKRVLMSMSETDYVFYKPRTRIAVPLLTSYNALAPGTIGRTVVITRGSPLPRELYLRMGAKRYGVWKLSRAVEARPALRQGPLELNTPFNVRDVKSGDLVRYSIALKHYAGDVALAGTARKTLEFRVDRRVELRPLPFFLSA